MSPLQRASRRRSALRPALLAWFDAHQRDLPWRRTRDPYAIWVSEVMLQQTQVDRVVGYFHRFLKRFPTIEALASASLDDVLSQWSGLGYYSRARNLHRAAKELLERHEGRIPASVEALAALPGFGRYTSAAVASIAFGVQAPLVDGNVARVFSRLFIVEGRNGDRARDHVLWGLADVLIAGPRPGDFNQSLMELGATTCLPSTPQCTRCPVAAHCAALALGRTHELPAPKRAAPRKRLELVVAIAQHRSRVLLARRDDGGLFGGLWELPSAVGTDEAALRMLLGPRAQVSACVKVVERTLTHRDLVLRLHPVQLPARLSRAPTGYLAWRWIEQAALGELGISSATRAAVVAALGEA